LNALTLVQLFRFLARRTDSSFTKTILRRLIASRTNRPPVSLSKIHQFLASSKKADRVAVVVGTVTDDERLQEVKKVTVAALRFTEAARARIVKAGGKCLTLDELVMQAPTGTNTLLLRGSTAREAKKHFGAAGRRRSHVKPYCRKGDEKRTGLSNR
jgi:large subunit ribosomal protein L18e